MALRSGFSTAGSSPMSRPAKAMAALRARALSLSFAYGSTSETGFGAWRFSWSQSAYASRSTCRPSPMRLPASTRCRCSCRSLITVPSGVELSSRQHSLGFSLRGSFATAGLLQHPCGVGQQVQAAGIVGRCAGLDVGFESRQREPFAGATWKTTRPFVRRSSHSGSVLRYCLPWRAPWVGLRLRQHVGDCRDRSACLRSVAACFRRRRGAKTGRVWAMKRKLRITGTLLSNFA